MGETLRARTVKWGEEHDRLIAEILDAARPFEPSVSHVVRVSIRRLHVELCMAPEFAAAYSSRQELQGNTRLLDRRRRERVA